METQLTCFNKKNMIPALCPHFLKRHRTPSLHLRNDTPPANRSQCISALLKFYLLSVKDGDLVHGKTPSVHFNMNGHVSLVLLQRQRCEIEDGMQSGPRHAGLIQTAFDVCLCVK